MVQSPPSTAEVARDVGLGRRGCEDRGAHANDARPTKSASHTFTNYHRASLHANEPHSVMTARFRSDARPWVSRRAQSEQPLGSGCQRDLRERMDAGGVLAAV